MIASLEQVLTAAGRFWLGAAIAVLVAAAFESAKPQGEVVARGPLGVIGGVTALIAPFLLLVHAFWAVAPHGADAVDGPPQLMNVLATMPQATLIALGVVIAVLLFAPSLLGWGLARTPLAPTLYRVSPWANAAALGFAIFVTYSSVAAVIELALNRPG